MMQPFDYRKLPWWARTFSNHTHILCFLGFHVPVRADTPAMVPVAGGFHVRSEYFCQNCLKSLSYWHWRRFFNG